MVGDGKTQFAERAGDDDAAAQHDLTLVTGDGQAQRVGRFRFWIEGRRWEWSEAVAHMHGYRPGAVEPTNELLLQHKHLEDRARIAELLERVSHGEPFSSRHRIIDTGGQTHWVIVVGDRMLDDAGEVTGTAGFYIDVTEALQSDVDTAVSAVTESRAVIEQAKGVLMAAYGIPADRAFDVLVWRSQETNTKVRELAARLLDALSGTLPAESVSLIDHTLLTL